MLRTFYRVLLWSFGFAAIGFAAYIAYGAYAEPRAEKLALDFCASVKVGDDPTAVLELAKKTDAQRAFLKWAPHEDGTKGLLVIYVGLPPFSRHVCAVTANSKVTSASYRHMD